MSKWVEDVCVIVRSVGERTEAACRALLCQQVPEAHVALVREEPFEHAIAESFRVGTQMGLLWTLCIDADVLVRPGAVSHLAKIAQAAPANVFVSQGVVLDKAFGGPRPAGNHIYRTELLNFAATFIPPVGASVRPETTLMKQMAARNHPWLQTDDVIGIHDFGQYFRDLYRKFFLQAHKHSQQIGPFLDLWRQQALHDPDFRVALKALGAGIGYLDPVTVDAGRFGGPIPNLLDDMGLLEKPELSADGVAPEQIEHLIASWDVPNEFYNSFQNMVGIKGDFPMSTHAKLKNRIEHVGYLRTGAWLFGRAVHEIGLRIMSIANKTTSPARPAAVSDRLKGVPISLLDAQDQLEFSEKNRPLIEQLG